MRTTQLFTDTESTTTRLALKKEPVRPTASKGAVDGGWLSASNDLEYELTELVPALASHVGSIERVLYRLEEWKPVPRLIEVASRRLHLDGYHVQPPHTLTICSRNNIDLMLLVVPHTTTLPAAQHILRSSAQAGNTETVQQLLGLTLTDVAPFTDPAVAGQRWDSDGGA